MDNCVLIRVAAAIDSEFRRSVLREIHEEERGRFRLVFELDGKSRSLLVSLAAAGLAWIGRPVERWAAPAPRPVPFVAACLSALRGGIVSDVTKAPADRRVAIRFAAGQSLVAELGSMSPNLVVLDGPGRVLALARPAPGPAARLREGEPYAAPAPPPDRFDPFGADAASIDAVIDERLGAGDSLERTWTRSFLGIGRDTAALLVREWRPASESPGTHLARRLAALVGGMLDPVIEDLGGTSRLLPWPPAGSLENLGANSGRLTHGRDPAETAGLHHDTLERDRALGERGAALRALLAREIRRRGRAEVSAVADLDSFSDPEHYRRWGEALLAGLSTAEPAGGGVRVCDPYDPDGRPIVIPVAGGKSLTQAATDYFQQSRRARRGLARAKERVAALAAERRVLEQLQQAYEGRADAVWMDELEKLLREQGIPVGLELVTRAARASSRFQSPRLAGVRLFTSSEGLSILVGKGGRENQRLTFKLAHPEDFWFHAQGVAGAHVVVRNDERKSSPPSRTLVEAAAAAAWYSDARGQAQAEVQWTRRKFVRKLKGAPPGTVRIKKFETVRVRPRSPERSTY